MTSEFIALGAAGQAPTRRRNHNGYLMRWDDQGILFDPGRKRAAAAHARGSGRKRHHPHLYRNSTAIAAPRARQVFPEPVHSSTRTPPIDTSATGSNKPEATIGNDSFGQAFHAIG